VDGVKWKLKDLKLNDGSQGLPKNPRFIRDERFAKLCESIKDNPEYMPARPIIIDENNVILGGNMRFRACKELGMKELPEKWVMRCKGWTKDKKRRFIILDNRGFGEDDMDLLANEWDIVELVSFGFDPESLKDILEDPESDPVNPEPDKNEECKTCKCPKCGHSFEVSE
jgi:hypothetical protein